MKTNYYQLAAVLRLWYSEDQILEIVGRGGAPLRAWARIDPGSHAGHLVLDVRGYEVLRLEPGADVEIRPLFRPELS